MTADPVRPRCVLLAGSSGTGKTAVCRVGHAVMVEAWGHPVAAIDLDTLYQAVDPRWELDYSDERNAMVMAQAAAWVRSLVGHGWRTVIVTGNSIFDPYDTGPFVAALDPDVAVHHVTLTVRPEVIRSRLTKETGRDPERAIADGQPANRYGHPGTVLLDSSDLDVRGVLDALVAVVEREAGLIGR